MTKFDIVTLLRAADGFDLVSETMNEGADEIERLRAVLERIAKSPDNDPDHLRWLAADALKEKE